MRRCICFLANALIFLSTLGATIRFFLNLRNFRKRQDKKLRSLYEKNRETVFLKDLRLKGHCNPHELPLTAWDDYESYVRQIRKNEQNVLTKEKVLILEPTSGTTTYTKYIPYTRGLQQEFNRAIRPWLAGLYLNRPSLFFSSQYWSISPLSQKNNEINQAIPVGFEQDSQYLGGRLSRVMDRIMTVPGQIKNIIDYETWARVTIFYLVRDKNLGLISVWHPSFLTILLEKIKTSFPDIISDIEKGRISCGEGRISPSGHGISNEPGGGGISTDSGGGSRTNESWGGGFSFKPGGGGISTEPWGGGISDKSGSGSRTIEPGSGGFTDLNLKPLPVRARELRSIDPSKEDFYRQIWPRLKVISCWADDPEENSLAELRKIFPSVWIQPKGLIATEGIISFPFGKTSGLPAYRSHLLEFIDLGNGELKSPGDLELHREYEPVISTGGGLYRYRMNDVVKVTGFYRNKLPLLQFLYKRDYVSDIRGEKVSLQHVREILKRVKKEWPEIRFIMLSPAIIGSKAFYCCYIAPGDNSKIPFAELAGLTDECLRKNFHYHHARQTGQLAKPEVFLLEKDPVKDIINHIESAGVKRGDIKLLPLSRQTIWPKILKGRFISQDSTAG